MAIVGVIEAQVRASTQDFERGMERASNAGRGFERSISQAARGAARGFGTAMTAIAASQAAQERSWVTLGATLVSSFAMGGPVMAGITAAAAAIGLLVSEFKQSGEGARKAGEQWDKEMEKRRAASQKFSEELNKLQAENRRRGLGMGGTEFDILVQNEQISRVRTLIAVDEARFKAMASTGDPEGTAENRQRWQEIKARLAREREELALLVTDRAKLVQRAEAEAVAQGQIAKETERTAAAQERIKAATTAPLPPGFGGTGRLTRDEWAELEARARAGQFTAGPPTSTPFSAPNWPVEGPVDMRGDPAAALFGWEQERDKARKKLEDEQKQALDRMEEEIRARAEAFAQPIHDAFADAITDGARTGFKNFGEIVRNFALTELSMAAQAFSHRFLGDMFSQIGGSVANAAGGSVVVQNVFSPAAAVAQGIDTSPALQTTINVVGSDVRTLEQFRRG